MVQELQSLQRQEWAHFADRFRFLGDDRGESPCRDDGGGMSQFSFHPADDTVDQAHIPKEEAALNASDRIDADHGFRSNNFHFG